ncbi:SbcC/MukB-like Walker B domain-containing protein [Streptomyces sp. NPDC056002]|uniref:SbcC/MukB-like Walker B domain-containing protein n=1 Tax=Streptomyces sp. NPDC056002 TaxID=3345675 RepID=UPI0035DC0634
MSAHLTDGKFLGHLTDLRTRALLAHGSELLQQLSGGGLGFAIDFDVVSLASNIPRSSRTLSGGETFQASLALSLALMEMHGRSGTRLESLFLDEGFGTLDTASLESALQVLRDHVGGGKLLAVISHLRPVAETVQDVLWVGRTIAVRRHAGSPRQSATSSSARTCIISPTWHERAMVRHGLAPVGPRHSAVAGLRLLVASQTTLCGSPPPLSYARAGGGICGVPDAMSVSSAARRSSS